MALQSRLMEGSGNASEEDKDEAEESEAEEEKAGKKRTIDDRQALFDMCTARCNHEEQEQYFVSMYGYFLTRGELQCLQRRRWINDRFMTMVAKTFVGDQKEKDGRVNRHIFSADFMQKMVANPLRWKWEDHEKEILPEYIGYNIGDCDFIFGPTLFEDHWFCYVFETKTMTFHALDSLVDSITFMRLQAEEEEAKKKGGEQQHDAKKKKKRTSKRQFDPKQFMATQTLSLDVVLGVTG
ncbi:sentrin-specific protease 2-like [Neltuma alba]|nr:sentrin-specific protease 2-like [Prosopis alba]